MWLPVLQKYQIPDPNRRKKRKNVPYETARRALKQGYPKGIPYETARRALKQGYPKGIPYEICEKYDEFAFLRQIKAEGEVKKIGFSYYDSPELLALHPEESMASWAIRFASSLDSVEIVLSGMNRMEQMTDNMSDQISLNTDELAALVRVAANIRSNTAIACTACNYCAPDCSMNIPISQYFALYNDYARNPGEDWKMQNVYDTLAQTRSKASDCIKCKNCENNCPQKLPITMFLRDVAKVFQ